MPPLPTLGYCTNVHAGANLDETRANLQKHALRVKQLYSPDAPMGIGLWLSAASARELVQTKQVDAFAGWLRDQGLLPYTFNGFPYGDFHQQVVKHRVYHPTWWDADRLAYTLQLIDILHALLPAGEEGSISTLPIGWGQPCPDREQNQLAAAQLKQVAHYLHDLEQRTGRLIYICIEPEPGCVFSLADDAIHFFQWNLFRGEDEEIVRRHIRLCHDVCHAAVMFEDQDDVLRRYQDAGIEVGKIQVSAALRMDLNALERPTAASIPLNDLSSFNEPRYLHQTSVRRVNEEGIDEDVFYEDLHLALAGESQLLQENLRQGRSLGEWRIHFHVPIYQQELGRLSSTQEQIGQCLQAAWEYSNCRHYEVETYAWTVLPKELRPAELADGIATELKWFKELWLNS
ncbi:metabolite traffic protein EboE [Anatilimnocola floriformis]|uniref:metabolite traffic protein EboE n=1 Tax=Anatilimnocola floriformis TaxID=2948575 RepID=UPI0020C2CF8E|nr:metabolite traffic protein EboE [Anatilimnocola floriformis]